MRKIIVIFNAEGLKFYTPRLSNKHWNINKIYDVKHSNPQTISELNILTTFFYDYSRKHVNW